MKWGLCPLAAVLWTAGCSDPATDAPTPPPEVLGAPIDAPRPQEPEPEPEPEPPPVVEEEPPAQPEPQPVPVLASAPAEPEVRDVTFEQLASYKFEGQKYLAEGPTPVKPGQIPADILALSGKTVRVHGFVIPMKFDGHKVEQFLLSRYFFTCCYGKQPEMNEYVEVTLKEPAELESSEEQMMEVTGVLEVGEALDPEGYLLSLYRMGADAVQKPR